MFFKRKAAKPKDPWPMEAEVFCLAGGDSITLRDCYEGMSVFGATGSGKSSGPGEMVASRFLEIGLGGLVMTTKPDEFQFWDRLCRKAGRLDDLVVFAPGEKWRFNFLDHELQSTSAAGGRENLVSLLDAVTEVSDRQSSGESGQEDKGFWLRSYRMLVRNAVDALVLGTGRVSVCALYELVCDAPQDAAEVMSEEWRKNSTLWAVLQAGEARAKSPREEHDFRLTCRYWLKEYPSTAEKTRSIIVATFTGIVSAFNRGVMRELFSTETNLTPEACAEGKVVVLDLPIKEWNELGRMGQVAFKFLFQRGIERRRSTRPVFLWADEASNFVTSYDALFQSTARSSRCATVYLCQNLPMYYAALGGEQAGKAATDALLGNLSTKIFLANSDVTTNQWAADLIGREKAMMMSTSMQQVGEGEHLHQHYAHGSASFSEQWHYKVQPGDFTSLKKGGPASGCVVQAVLFQNGRTFKASGDNHLFTNFAQGKTP